MVAKNVANTLILNIHDNQRGSRVISDHDVFIFLSVRAVTEQTLWDQLRGEETIQIILKHLPRENLVCKFIR